MQLGNNPPSFQIIRKYSWEISPMCLTCFYTSAGRGSDCSCAGPSFPECSYSEQPWTIVSPSGEKTLTVHDNKPLRISKVRVCFL